MANPNPRTDHLEATRFQPGHPGLGGRPKKRPQTESNDAHLRSNAPAKVRAMFAPMGLFPTTWAEVNTCILQREALKGGARAVQAIIELRESTEGKTQRRFEFVAEQDRTVVVEIEYAALDAESMRRNEVFERARALPEPIDIEPSDRNDAPEPPIQRD
jgi:hypothetical protein